MVWVKNHGASKVYESRSKNSEMSSIDQASDLVRFIGTTRAGSVREAITCAARRLGWSYSRTKNIWYKDAKRIDAHEIDRLREIQREVAREQAVASMVAIRREVACASPAIRDAAAAALDTVSRVLGGTLHTEGEK
jgi:hypothetical protein